ncbi:MAG: hypothetical protein ACK5L0_04880 [Candidatus Fimivivens sp.]
MSFEVILSRPDGSAFDISGIVGQTEVIDRINQAGSCSFSAASGLLDIQMGNAIMVRHDGAVYHKGYVFSTSKTKAKTIAVSTFDQIKYLKASDSKAFDNLSLDAIIRQLCTDYGLAVGMLEPTGFPLGALAYDGKQLLDMIVDAIRQTTRGAGALYYFKDIAGAVVLRNVKSSVTDLVLSPDSLITDYSYTQSLDDTYNKIKLVRDNKTAGKREVYIAQDSNTIKSWGLLQFYEKVDDGLNPELIKQKANVLLALKNRIGQTLELDALGDTSIRAGNVIYISIPEVGLEKMLLCTEARHTFTNAAHTVKVKLRIV